MTKHARTGMVALFAAAGLSFGLGAGAATAQTVMQQCGQQYQAAKAAGTLNNQSWNDYRTACAARLKAQGSAATPAPVVAATPTTPANPLKPAPSPAPATPAQVTPAPVTPAPTAAADKNGKPVSAGLAAFHVRQKQCGAEWRANKASLVAQTPGLTWPKYLHLCNDRLKATGK